MAEDNDDETSTPAPKKEPTPIIKVVKYYIDRYAPPGVEELRAVKTFIECGTYEELQSLRAELHAIANGKIPDKTLDGTVGKPRALKHGSYANWAKAMFLWLAAPMS